MLRRFTREVGRFQAGAVKDWPPLTWRAFGEDFNDFSEPVVDEPKPVRPTKQVTRGRKN